MKEKETIKMALEEEMPNKNRIYANSINYGAAAKSPAKKKAVFFAISLVGVLVFVLTLSVLAATYSPINSGSIDPKSGNYSKIYEVITKYGELLSANNRLLDLQLGASAPSENYASIEAPTSDLAQSPSQSKENSTSMTNIQTEGFDEGDIIKWDSNYIYKLSMNGCYIISANNGLLEAVAEIEIANYVPKEMFISGNKLIIIGGIYDETVNFNSYDIEPLMSYAYAIPCRSTDIRIYDITDRSNPILSRSVLVSGFYSTSRLRMSDNKLIYMLNYGFSPDEEKDNQIPSIKDSSRSSSVEKFPEDSLYYYEDLPYYSYFIIGEIDLDAPDKPSQIKAFLGLSGEIYISTENVYLAATNSFYLYRRNVFNKFLYVYSPSKTRIVKLSQQDLSHVASQEVDGTVLNRFSLDEFNNNLRVATSTDSGNDLYVLDGDLKIIGTFKNFGSGERIYSARFNETSAVIVTFKNIDPYFAFDLSDPRNPKLVGYLKENGVSKYLHYIGDSGYTIGIGENQDEAGAALTALKVSLYKNVQDDNPINVDTVIIGDNNVYVYAAIFNQSKALYYDAELGLFGFSYETWNWSGNYNSRTKQYFALFSFDVDLEHSSDQLKLLDTITHTPSQIDDYYLYSQYFISRGFRIGNYFYTASDKLITSYSIDQILNGDKAIIFDTLTLEMKSSYEQ
ncbi:MAG: beta-propeller domain-containing protein [Christensenellaceae bacterium]|jgi:uncharacterized secreted protein with C-terminal beta-propeller domain|nr:beta-propeller domain-containing protein [Christensenellaceae bacterium]